MRHGAGDRLERGFRATPAHLPGGRIRTHRPFEIPRHWQRGYGLEVGLGATAAIWGALDPQSNILYPYDEYCGMGREPASVHAWAIQRRGRWIPGVLDVEGNDRTQRDGYRLLEMYRRLGLKVQAAGNLIESGIQEVWQRMNTGGLKVFASLEHYLEELRHYHRDERDQIVTERDHVQNATRCLVINSDSCMRTEPVKPVPEYRSTDFSRSPYGWMR